MTEPVRAGPVRAGTVDALREAGMTVVPVGRTPVLVLWDGEAFRALDNRCPHMGFPLHTGDVRDGLLACHWHHARFDVTCGQTLDPWADDVDCYAVEVRDGAVFVDPRRPRRDTREHGLARLGRGLEDNLALVTFKAVVELAEGSVDWQEPAARGAAFGAGERVDGWQPGLSILSAMTNVRATLDPVDRQRALGHALAHVARDCAGRPPRRPIPGLDGTRRDCAGLRTWLRETVEVRDADGAERVLRTLVVEHGSGAALDAVLASCTDHRYSDVGHTLDYALKCAELCDALGDAGDAALLFTSLVPQLVRMQRMEETSAWRQPVDVAAIVDTAWARVGEEPFSAPADCVLEDEVAVVALILGEAPDAAADDLVRRLAAGDSPVALAEAVVTAATQRVLQFGTVNETADWDTVHHTLTYANAVAEGMRRAPSRELFRAVLDGAMSVYLDRFLNVPAVPLPREPAAPESDPDACLEELLAAYDTRSSVDACADLAWRYLRSGGPPERLLAALGHAVLREDSGFHECQQLEIAWRRLARRPGRVAELALVAAARWLAAQYPTRRAREQTFQIARRLHRGEALHEA